MDHSYSIEFEGVRLRPLARGDIEALRVWRNDEANSRYIRKIPHVTPEAQEKWFEGYLDDDTVYTFAICVDGQLVGSVSLYDPEGSSVEFGKLMVGSSKGQGVGKRATKAVLALAFDVLGFDEVKAEVSVDNTTALIIYTRVGFSITGRRYNELAEMDEFTILLEKADFRR